jgi:hypothetical protein
MSDDYTKVEWSVEFDYDNDGVECGVLFCQRPGCWRIVARVGKTALAVLTDTMVCDDHYAQAEGWGRQE